MRSRLICLAAACGILSCRSEEDGRPLTAIETARLSAQDLAAPPSVPALSMIHVKTKIDESKAMTHELGMQTATLTDTDRGSVPANSDLQAQDEGQAVTQCIQDLIDSIRMKASVDTVVVDEILDFAPCLALSPDDGDGSYTVQDATIGLFVQVSCADGDYSPADGKTMAEAQSLIPAECASTYSYLSNSTVRTVAMVEDEGLHPIDTIVIESEGREDNSPCQALLVDGLRSESDCISISKEVDNLAPENNYFQRIISRDLRWMDGQAGDYFDSGRLDVQVNDWTGEVTFAGQNMAPSYTMSNGAETLAGTLDTRPLELFARVKKSLAAKIANSLRR